MENLVTASTLTEKTLEKLKTQMPSSCDDAPLVYEFDVNEEMLSGGFPRRFLWRDWKTPEFVKKYAPPDSRDGFRDFKGLFLTGPTGRKKSASLTLLARDWIVRMGRRGSNVWRFVSFPEVCVALQDSWKEGGRGPMDLIDSLVRVPLLILDDVGAEKTTDFVLQSAYLIFNRREQDEMPTYGTSNLTIEEIGAKLDDRIASRIKGMCHVVQVGGEDQRGKA